MIPALDAIFRQAAEKGVTDIIIAMPHVSQIKFFFVSMKKKL
jgi:hypothetical protein